MDITKNIAAENFNAIAAGSPELPQTSFVNHMKKRYDSETANKVLNAFGEIGLPAPAGYEEFVMGAEGELVSLKRYGLVLRIEGKKEVQQHWGNNEIKDSPFLSKPLASIDVGGAHIQICAGAGCLGMQDESSLCAFLADRLSMDGIAYYDQKHDNAGLMPASTPLFPSGIPIVIDRGAVEERTWMDTKPISEAERVKMAAEAKEAAAADETLYAPLRQAFDVAWPDKTKTADTEKMKHFFLLCQDYVSKGKLIASWEYSGKRISGKSMFVANTAKAYETRLQAAERCTADPSVPPALKLR
jgi:hypothetical protein